MKRECDSLISIVEKKKVELLKRVSDEYQDKLSELSNAMNQCEQVLLQGDGLAEFTQEALKEESPATFLQVKNVNGSISAFKRVYSCIATTKKGERFNCTEIATFVPST